jgi:deoxyadenosine/deoxycytidine kinase
MEREYIQELNSTYESFFGDHHQGAVVLPIDTDHLDYIHSSQALRHVENRIRQTLQLPPFQQELPLESRAD